MSDPERTQNILANIMTAIERMERRYQGIHSPEDFVVDNDRVVDWLDRLLAHHQSIRPHRAP